MAMMIAPVRMRAEPRADPRYARVKAKLEAQAKAIKKHPPASKKASEPAKAAKAPADEKAAGAKANQVDKIEEAPTPPPKPATFLETLQAEIAKVMPKTLGDTEKFMQGGDSSAIKDSMKGGVESETGAATKDMQSASDATPSEAGVPSKPVTPIPPEGETPAPQVDAPGAMPAPKSAQQTSLQGSKEQIAEDLDKKKLSKKRLANAHDSRFSAVVTAQDKVNQQADAGPGKYRAAEKGALGAAANQAIGVARKGATNLLATKKGSQSKVTSKQEEQKAKEEKELQEFTTFVTTTFDATKKAVDTRLETLETTVNDMFDRGTDTALANLKSSVEDDIFNWKLERYLLKPGGSLLWIKDQILDLPDEVNQFYEAGRQRFQTEMNALAVKVAAHVETELAAAKAEVKAAQVTISAKQKSLAPAVQARATAITSQYAEKFSELEQGIEDKKQSLAEGLAQKYKEAFDKAAEVEKGIKDSNKGLVTQAKEKIEEVAKALAEFKDKLMAILRKGAETIELILDDPGGFLSNLLAAIKAGFNQFAGNILTHLKAGFTKWLFGAFASAGIEIPADLSPASILKLVLSVLGITYDRMRAKAVKLIGNTAVTAIEKVVEYVKALVQGGPAALWAKVQDDLSNLKGMVIDAIRDWIISTIVKKAVAKVVSMFNPAGAIIQAVLMIISVVQFVIERAAQIAEFVEAVINSIHAIATGAIGGAANWIEKSLANMIPILIGFLAALVGLGGLAAKVKGFILKVQGKVDKAIDKVLKKIVDTVKKLFGKLLSKVKGKDERTEAEKKADLEKAMAEAQSLQSDSKATEKSVRKGMAAIQKKYKMQSLTLVVDAQEDFEETVHLLGKINPEKPTRGSRIRKDGTVGPLGIVRKMLTWEETTLQHFFKDKIWKAEQAMPGDYAGAEIDIRHKVSISDTIKNTDNAIAPKQVDPAVDLISSKGGKYKPAAKTKPGIVGACKQFLQDANNDVKNLFLGPARPNRSLGKKYDPGEGGKARSAASKKQQAQFAEKWGFKDEAFVVTIERKSEARGTKAETETYNKPPT